jgi:multidrug/hemolysin transport system ATP-binding protein
MEEAAEADHVVILENGRIVAEGSPLSLKNEYTGDFITLYGVSEEDVIPLGLPYERVSGAIRIAVQSTAAATALILAHPALFSDYEVVKGKMDDVFLAVTGKTLSGGDEK